VSLLRYRVFCRAGPKNLSMRDATQKHCASFAVFVFLRMRQKEAADGITRGSDGKMRIVVQPPHHLGAPDQSVRLAHEVLRTSNIFSVRAGGIMNDRAVLFVAAADVPQALAALIKAGMRAVVE
jgi:hypothetical protein